MDRIDADTLFFFDGKPHALALYAELMERIDRAFSPVDVRVQKTQITLTNPRVFACVSIARVKKKAELLPEYLVLTLGLPAPLNSPRVAVKSEPYPNRWTHHLVLSDQRELDDELMGWIRQAYTFSAGKR